MKTSIDARAAPGGFSIEITRVDGEKIRLHFGTHERTTEAAFFLLEAFSQECVAAIDDAHTRLQKTLDEIEKGVRS